MAIHEIRDQITVEDYVDPTENDWTLFIKKIPLEFGKRHTLVHIDFFDDGFTIPFGPAQDLAYEFYVSRYPIYPTRMGLNNNAFSDRGPAAANDNVLFKMAKISRPTDPAFQGPYEQEFPNQFLGQTKTFSWYSDFCYLNLLVHADYDPTAPIADLAFSIYMAVESKKCDDVEWSIGAIREYDEAQYVELETMGVVQALQGDTLNPTGRWVSFPSWSWGGIRPERMLDTQSTAGASLASSFINLGPNQAEPMMDDDNMRIFFKASRTMVNAGEAFGSDDALKGPIPDWLNFSAMTAVYGAQRPQFPALKFTDTGVTLML